MACAGKRPRTVLGESVTASRAFRASTMKTADQEDLEALKEELLAARSEVRGSERERSSDVCERERERSSDV